MNLTSSGDSTPPVGPLVVGLGEALFDCFPDGRHVGGAPVNVALHCDALLRGIGGRGVVASAIGADSLGRELADFLAERSLDPKFMQIHPTRPTGSVRVTFDKREPCYCFQDDVAWDHLRYDENWQRLAMSCAAVSFGTLAQRSPESREAIVRFLRDARQAMRLFDVNLRQSFYSTEVIWQSLELATAAKCNVEELHILGRSLDLEGPKTAESDGLAFEIMARFDLDWIAVTRGRLGTSLYAERGRFEANVPEYPAVEGADSVGAGDASGAGLMIGSLLGWPNIRRVAFANELGSYVSSRRGAIPPLPEWLLARVAADTSSSAGNVLATK